MSRSAAATFAIGLEELRQNLFGLEKGFANLFFLRPDFPGVHPCPGLAEATLEKAAWQSFGFGWQRVELDFRKQKKWFRIKVYQVSVIDKDCKIYNIS